MPQKLHIVRARDFLRLDAQGTVDFESSRRGMEAVAKACVESGLDCALLDLREVQKHLSITDLWTLASTFGQMGFQAKHRLAILHRLDAMDRADFFAMCAANRGYRVAAFDTFEDAFEWISETTPVGEGTIDLNG